MTPVLAANGIRHAYDGPEVLAGVDTTVQGGELVGIVGPNGAGKSTLLRIMAGLLAPVSGQVTLNDTPLASIPRDERARNIAFLPQAVNPAFSLTVFEVVGLGRFPYLGALSALRSGDRAIVEQVMEATQVVSLRDRSFVTLSGGERQRVLVASILAQEPRLLLLDEPTSALDLHHQVELMSLLRKLADEGYGVAVVTHDVNLAARFCNRIVLLAAAHGLVGDGPPETILTESLLSRAYDCPLRVSAHPLFGTPLVSAEEDEGSDA
jgi:iron complex transport system ATP-binding protein